MVKDLQYLSRLMNLTKLRIDDNPFSKFEHTRHFAIHCAKSLVYLDGYAVTQEERVSARTLFASTDISELRGRLSEELHKLSLLKSDVGKSPEEMRGSNDDDESTFRDGDLVKIQSRFSTRYFSVEGGCRREIPNDVTMGFMGVDPAHFTVVTVEHILCASVSSS